MKKFIALAMLFTLASANDPLGQHARLAKRLAATTTSSASSSSAATSASSASTVSGSVASSSATTPSAVATSVTGTLSAGVIPALTSISLGQEAQATVPLSTTYAAGATPPISGAPALPTPFIYKSGVWPAQDKPPDTSSPEVQEWLKEIEGFNIPNINTTDGTCAGSPQAAASAARNGWWTCGGYTRPSDVVSCPTKFTWGTSFDDGPSPYTMQLLDFLNEKDIQATFFVVGSRVIERPDVLVAEYMDGHEISVHTWSHTPLTSQTNEEIVAELGWTRKAIQEVLGITPVTMRPPYGDIDDRVRAIALAMGMVPVIWTRGPQNNQFDTNDWKIAGGEVTSEQSLQSFKDILGNATEIDTGFIVLEHDLFVETVDMAVGYFLPLALNFTPKLTMEAIGKCQGWPATNLYLETTTNTTFPYLNLSSDVGALTTALSRASAARAAGIEPSSSSKSSARPGLDIPALNTLLAVTSVLVGGLLMV